MIKIATAGKGIGSLIINTKATTKIIIAVFPSLVNLQVKEYLINRLLKLSRKETIFLRSPKRKLLNEMLEKPNKEYSKWT